MHGHLTSQRNFPKHVEFYSKKINFEKLVHLVGFIIRIYHNARSPNVTKVLSETCRLLFQKINFEKLVHLVGFIMGNYETREKLLARFLDSAALIKKLEDRLRRTTRHLRTRITKCVKVDGGIFEH